jgi:L,D-transpeptidase ErfK/SrfK
MKKNKKGESNMRIQGLCIFLLLIAAVLSTSVSFAKPYGQRVCQSSAFICLHIKRNQSWESLFPNEHDRSIVMRLNRMNTVLYRGAVIAVPKNLAEADIMDFSPFPLQASSSGEKLIVIDPASHAWGAYATDGSLVRWGPASLGAKWCNDLDEPCLTTAGSYRIFSLGSSECISHKFPLPEGGAPMPYCMYFNNGQALHGEPNGLPGENVSHGCVRLYVNDAEWLRYDFAEGPNANNHYQGTRVIVYPYQ